MHSVGTHRNTQEAQNVEWTSESSCVLPLLSFSLSVCILCLFICIFVSLVCVCFCVRSGTHSLRLLLSFLSLRIYYGAVIPVVRSSSWLLPSDDLRTKTSKGDYRESQRSHIIIYSIQIETEIRLNIRLFTFTHRILREMLLISLLRRFPASVRILLLTSICRSFSRRAISRSRRDRRASMDALMDSCAPPELPVPRRELMCWRWWLVFCRFLRPFWIQYGLWIEILIYKDSII